MKPRRLNVARLSFPLAAALAALLSAPTANAAVYYWDDDAATPGFGTAGASTGTWAAPTAGPTAGWSLSATGVDVFAGFTTATTDALNFGTATDGLGSGSITVGTVSSGNITFGSASDAITLSGGTITLAAAATITVDNATDTINSILAGAATSLTKAGTGILILGGANTYAGTTIINAGTIKLGAADRIANAGVMTVNVNGSFDLGGFAETIARTSGVGTVTNTGSLATLTMTSSGNTISNSISGALNLSFQGASTTYTLNTAASHTGSTIIGTGGIAATKLVLGGTNYLPTTTAVTADGTNSNVALDLQGFNQTIGQLTLGTNSGGGATSVTGSGSSTLTLTNGARVDGHNNGGGAITVPFLNLNGATQTFSILSGSNTSDLTISSTIQNGALTKDGANTAGSLILSGTNTYAGNTTITSGIVEITGSGSLGSGSYNGTISNSGTFQYSSSTSQILSGAITGAGVLTKNTNAASTLTLSSATNSYTGATNVSAGTLAIASTGILANTAIAVTNSGTTFKVTPDSGTVNLGNTGTAAAGATLNLGGGTVFSMVDGTAGGTTNLRQGSSVTTGLALASANLNFELSGATADKLAVTRAAVVSGVNNINITPLAALTPGTYNLITALSGLNTGGTFVLSSGINKGLTSFGGTPYVLSLNNAAGIASVTVDTGVYWTGQTSGNGAADVSWNTAGSTNWATGASDTTYANGNNVIFQDTNAVAGGSAPTGVVTIQAAGVTPGATIFDNSAVNYTVSNASGTIGLAGSGGLVKQGSGSLTLNSANTFTGGVGISAGNLIIGNAGALNSTAGSENAVTFGAGSTGTLSMNGTSLVIRSLNTNPTNAGTAFVENASATPATLTIGNTGNAASTFSGVIRNGTGGGALTITKAGTGALLLSTSNTYTGGTNLNGAGPAIDLLPGMFGTGTITFNANNTINTVYGAYSTFTNAVSVAGSATATFYTGNQYHGYTFQGALTGSGTVSVTNMSNGSNSGPKMAFTNSGNTFTGTLILSGSGNVNLNSLGDSTVSGTNPIRLGAGTSIELSSGTASSMLFTNRPIQLTGAAGTSAIYNNSNNGSIITIAQPLSFTAVTAAKTLNLGGGNAGENTFGGIIANSGGNVITLTKDGGGKWILSGANTYTGKTSINAGTLSINSIQDAGSTTDNALGKPAAGVNSIITIGSAANTGTLIYTGALQSTSRGIQIGTNSATPVVGDTGGAIIRNDGAGALTFSAANFNTATNAASGTSPTRTLTLQGLNADANTISGIIANNQIAGSPTAAVAVTKSGIGTWVLSGANSYTGATTVSAGSLLLGNGGGLGATAVSVNGGTFGIKQTADATTNALTGALALNAGSTFTMVDGFTTTLNLPSAAPTLAPASGVSPVLTFNTAAADTVSDRIAITGTGTVGAAKAIINVIPIAAPSASTNTYTLITAAGGGMTPGNFVLGTSNYNIGGTLYSGSLSTSTASAMILSFTAGSSAPPSAFWTGGTNSSWAQIDGTTFVTNFTNDAASTSNTLAIPAATSTVIMSANSATNLTTTLDQAFSIAGLVFSGTGTSNTAGSSIASGTGGVASTLSLGSGGVTVNAGSGANSISAPVILGAAQSFTNNGTSLLSVSGDISNGANLLTLAAAGNITLSGVIGNGAGGLTKTGAGTLALTNTNTYTGVTSISGGVVEVSVLADGSSNSSLGASSGAAANLVFLGGVATNVLRYVGSADISTNRAFTTANGGSGGATIESSGDGILTFTSTNALSYGTNSENRQLIFGGTNIGDNTFAKVIANNGSGVTSITKNGVGTWILSGLNTNTGATTVNAGTLSLTGARAAAAAGAITVGSNGNNATLNISNGTYTVGNNGFSVGTSATGSVTGTINQSGGTVTFTPNGNNGMLIGNGVASGVYNLSVGTLSSSGTVTTSRGIMLGVNDNASATFNLSGTGILNNAGGVLMVGRSDAALTSGTTNTVAYNQTGGTATTASLTIGGNSAGSNTINATFSVTGGSFSTNAFTLLSRGNNNTSTLTIGGTAQVTLPVIPTARGTGSSASITFDSSAGGYLRPAASSTIYMPAGTFSTAKLTANGARIDTNNLNITVEQVLQDNTTLGALTKLGTGTLTLAGINTFSGNTSINAGTLKLDSAGSIANSANITLASSATLDVSTVTTALTLSSGQTLRSSATGANTTATVTTVLGKDLTLSAGGLSFTAYDGTNGNSATNAPLTVTGASAGELKLNGAPVTVTTTSSLALGTYVLVAKGGSALVTGTPGTLTVNGAGAAGATSLSVVGDQLVLTVGADAVPPTLTSINDNVTGGPINIGATVTYTVTFNEDIDSASVTALDFDNNGTAGITVGAPNETSPGVFTVAVTANSAGSLKLRIPSGAVIEDVALNDLVVPVEDDTTITVRTPYATWAAGYLPGADVSNPASNYDGDALTNLQEYAFGTNPTVSSGGSIEWVNNGAVTTTGQPVAFNFANPGVDYRAVFGRRKDHVAAGLTYTVEFSAELNVWVASGVTPTVLTGAGGLNPSEIEAVSVPYPLLIDVGGGNFKKPTLFRVRVAN